MKYLELILPHNFRNVSIASSHPRLVIPRYLCLYRVSKEMLALHVWMIITRAKPTKLVQTKTVQHLAARRCRT